MHPYRVTDLATFYDLISEIEARHGGRRTFATPEAEPQWPQRGIYFFFEAGETRSVCGQGDRIVRVASHSMGESPASGFRAGFMGIRGARSGRGNHRSSIFRQLVGEALLRRSGRTLASWGLGGGHKDAAKRLGADLDQLAEQEAALEMEVSDYIGRMGFTWMALPDSASPDGRRGYFERQSIALLSNLHGAADPPSEAWLGRYSRRERVRESGLWNNNHVHKDYDDGFLSWLEASSRADD